MELLPSGTIHLSTHNYAIFEQKAHRDTPISTRGAQKASERDAVDAQGGGTNMMSSAHTRLSTHRTDPSDAVMHTGVEAHAPAYPSATTAMTRGRALMSKL